MNKHSIITGVALALTLGAASVASAQGTQRQERPRGAQADSGRGGRGGFGREGMLLEGITLSESQKAKVAELGAKQRKQMEANRPKRERGDTTGMGVRRAQMEKQRDQQIASLRAILDNSQRAQLDKNVAAMKSRVGQRGGREGFGGRNADGQKKAQRPSGEQK